MKMFYDRTGIFHTGGRGVLNKTAFRNLCIARLTRQAVETRFLGDLTDFCNLFSGLGPRSGT